MAIWTQNALTFSRDDVFLELTFFARINCFQFLWTEISRVNLQWQFNVIYSHNLLFLLYRGGGFGIDQATLQPVPIDLLLVFLDKLARASVVNGFDQAEWTRCEGTFVSLSLATQRIIAQYGLCVRPLIHVASTNLLKTMVLYPSKLSDPFNVGPTWNIFFQLHSFFIMTYSHIYTPFRLLRCKQNTMWCRITFCY